MSKVKFNFMNTMKFNCISKRENKNICLRKNICSVLIMSTILSTQASFSNQMHVLEVQAKSQTKENSSVATTKNLANLRDSPSIKSNTIVQLKKGVKVVIKGKEGYWYEVATESNQVGYVAENLLIVDVKVASIYNVIKSNYKPVVSFSTRFTAADVNRNANIEKASIKSTTLLNPNQEFSFNKLTGDSTKESNGWYIAGVIENGKSAQGVGGGICQVSSTIHATVLQAPTLIKVTSRKPHSKPVGYVKIEQEAMVNYGVTDFKFKNISKKALVIHTVVNHSSGTLTTTLYEVN